MTHLHPYLLHRCPVRERYMYRHMYRYTAGQGPRTRRTATYRIGCHFFSFLLSSSAVMMTSAKKKRKNICRKRQEKEHLSEKVSEKAVWFSKVPGHPSVRQVPIWQVHVPAHVPVHVPGPDPAGTCTSCTDVPDIYAPHIS